MSKQKNIALVSLNSAGTGGHLSTVKNLLGYFKSRKFYPVVISDCDYSIFLPEKLFFELGQVEKRGKTGLGGAIDDTYNLQLIKILGKINPRAVVFVGFFPPNLVKRLKYPAYFVSASGKLRDTHREVFFMNKSYSLFKRVYFMSEAYEVFEANNTLLIKDRHFKNVCYCPPALSILDEKLPIFKRKKIIITCGGGGLRGANKFLLTVNEALFGMDLLSEVDTTYITGPFHEMKYELLHSSKSKQCSYVKDLWKEFGKCRLVISECGPHTVNELVVTGTPALLIPGFRSMDNQELRAVKSSIFGFDWIFPEYLNPDYLRKKIKKLLEKDFKNSNRLAASKLLLKGRNVLFDSLYQEVIK